MISQVEFTKDFRCFTAGDVIDFRPGVNLLVGDQGCGKSTLLATIRNCGSKLKVSDRAYRKERCAVVKVKSDGPVQTMAFDFEYDNLRTKGHFGANIQQQVGSMFASHGEVNRVIHQSMGKAENTIIFLDEPDMALSIRSCYELARTMQDCARQGCQIIAAVHSYVVIEMFEFVLSLEHREWMESGDFISDQYSDEAFVPKVPEKPKAKRAKPSDALSEFLGGI
jgi:predicted ATPase